MRPEQERDLELHAVGHLSQNKVFLDHQAMIIRRLCAALTCLVNTGTSTMVWCLFCQVFKAMGMQRGPHRISSIVSGGTTKLRNTLKSKGKGKVRKRLRR